MSMTGRTRAFDPGPKLGADFIMTLSGKSPCSVLIGVDDHDRLSPGPHADDNHDENDYRHDQNADNDEYLGRCRTVCMVPCASPTRTSTTCAT
jgi:hypothetical protein